MSKLALLPVIAVALAAILSALLTWAMAPACGNNE